MNSIGAPSFPPNFARCVRFDQQSSRVLGVKRVPRFPTFLPLSQLYLGLRGRPVGCGAPSDFRAERRPNGRSLCGGGDTLPQSPHHSLSNAAADFTRWASSCGADAHLRVFLVLG
ncbi:uncharacterized, partial [Tachysurus ichikawai]